MFETKSLYLWSFGWISGKRARAVGCVLAIVLATAIPMTLAPIAKAAEAATQKAKKDKADKADKPEKTDKSDVGEKVPSEDGIIKDLHALGLVNGKVDIFRSASPVRELVKGKDIPTDLSPLVAEANARLMHLHDLGIRTIVSLEDPDPKHEDTESTADGEHRVLWIKLEKDAAAAAGIQFVSRPLNNTGKDSFETLSDQDVMKELDAVSGEVLGYADKGGVLFHCAAGHDRTGMVAAYIRMKYQKWPVQQAIDEMRRLGHNWVKYSNNGGVSSWHEEHLKGIGELMAGAK